GLDVPQPEVEVGAAGEDSPAVGKEADHSDPMALLPLEAADLRTGVEVPDAHRAVHRARRGPVAVGADGHAPDAVPVAGEAADFLARVEVPEVQIHVRLRLPAFRRHVQRSTGERIPSVGSQREAEDGAPVVVESAKFTTRSDLIDPDIRVFSR